MSANLSMGGGGLGAGGAIYVAKGGTLDLGAGNSFSDDAVQGGVAVNPGLGLGNDLFVQGRAMSASAIRIRSRAASPSATTPTA